MVLQERLVSFEHREARIEHSLPRHNVSPGFQRDLHGVNTLPHSCKLTPRGEVGISSNAQEALFLQHAIVYAPGEKTHEEATYTLDSYTDRAINSCIAFVLPSIDLALSECDW